MDDALNIPKYLTGDTQSVKDTLVGYAKRIEGRATTDMYMKADRYISENIDLFNNIHAYLGNRINDLGRRVAAALGKRIPEHAVGHEGKYVNLVVSIVNLGLVPPAHTEGPDGTLKARHSLTQLATDAAALPSFATEEDIVNSIKLASEAIGLSGKSPLSGFMRYVDTYVDNGGSNTRYIARLFAASPLDIPSGKDAGMVIGYLASKQALLPQLVGSKFRSTYSNMAPQDTITYRSDALAVLADVYKMRESGATGLLDKLFGSAATTSRW